MLGPAPSLVAAHWGARGVSRGPGSDLEWEWGEAMGCAAARLLAPAATAQIGGPWADPKAPLMGKVEYGWSAAAKTGFRANATRCHQHVLKAASGSIVARRDRIQKEEEEERGAEGGARHIRVTPGQPLSLADMMRQATTKTAERKEPAPLSECERAKHAHDRCTNDNPPGKHGFVACCRALAGMLFGCAEDFKWLPPHQRTLYAPSYTHFCAPLGHAPLPPGYPTEQAFERVSEFMPSRLEAEKEGCDMAAIGGVKGPGDEHGMLRLDAASGFVVALSWTVQYML